MTSVRSSAELDPPGKFHDDAGQSWTLPSSWYVDPNVFEREKEAIFCRNWWYAGAEAGVREPGCCMVTTVVDQEVMIVRGTDDKLRAFHNVCRHRGHRLVDGAGCRKSIVCPYHGWTYGTDGRFIGGRGVDAIAGFDRAAAALVPVQVESMLGLVFVNLDTDATPLADVASGMLADMRAHCPDLDTLVLAQDHQVETAANWKTLVDNDLESYHSATAHAALMGLLDYESFKVWEYEFATCHSMENSNPNNDAYAVGDNAAVKTAIYT